MRRATPDGLFSWRYTIRDGGTPVAAIEMNMMATRGTVRVGGVPYTFRQEDLLGRRYGLAFEGVDIAVAERDRVWTRHMTLEVGLDDEPETLTLSPTSPMTTGYAVHDRGREVGRVERDGWMTRAIRIDLPDTVPLALQGFVAALVAIDLRRQRSG